MKSPTDYGLIARSLADTLMQFGLTRDIKDSKEVLRLQTELCTMRRKELAEPKEQDAAE